MAHTAHPQALWVPGHDNNINFYLELWESFLLGGDFRLTPASVEAQFSNLQNQCLDILLCAPSSCWIIHTSSVGPLRVFDLNYLQMRDRMAGKKPNIISAF